MPQILIILGTILTLIGGAWMYINTSKFNEELSNKTNENNALSKENRDLSSLNTDLTKEVLDQSYIIKSSITGGDSYCKLVINGSNQAFLYHQGEFPVYSIQMTIYDLKADKSKPFTLDTIQNSTRFVNELKDGTSMLLEDMKIAKNKTQDYYNVSFMTRNKTFRQLIRRRKSKGQWYNASQLYDLKEKVIMEEEIDEGFPFNSEGEDIWQDS